MTIRELLTTEIDIDVCDDYDESCYIAFCGPVHLTEKGAETFAPVLDWNVKVYNDIAIIEVADEGKMRLLRTLFKSCAGYCSIDNYNLYFNE